MSFQNDPIITLPVLNISGLIVSNNATTPNTKLDISAGTCRDSANVMDITLGASNPNLEGGTVSAPLTINTAVIGANGIDAGTLAASSLYAVYIVASSQYRQPTAAIVSLASNSAPTMPFGYDSYRLIGYVATDGSAHFLLMYISGTGNSRVFTYDAPQATSVTAGAATSYTGIALTALVCPVANTPVLIQSDFTANAANDSLKLQGYNSTGDAVTIVAPVAGSTAHTWTISQVLAQLNTAAPSIKYKVSSGSDAVAINVAGFQFFV